jgi:chromosome segregation ATPase
VTNQEDYGPRLDRLECEVFELKQTIPQQMKAMGVGIGMVYEATQRLQFQMAAARSDIAGLTEDVGGLKRDVRVLKTDVSVLKTDVHELKGDVASLRKGQEVLTNDMAEVKAAVAEIPGIKITLNEILRRLDSQPRKRVSPNS